MTSHQEFTKFLWESLEDYRYVCLNPNVKSPKEETVPEILVTKKSIKKLLPQLRQHPAVRSCRASFRFQNTLALFSFEGWKYSISFVHKMVSQNLFFFEEEEIFAQRVKTEEGIYIAGVEHLFEYSVLKSFLNRKGIPETDYAYFSDFHFFAQEGLIEYFNERYNTHFDSLFDFTQYQVSEKRAMIAVLNEMPINRLSKVLNIHWHNFLGRVRKEARMI